VGQIAAKTENGKMALGLNYETADAGSIIPVVKYDARAGKILRIDRVDGSSEPIDITYDMMDAAKGGAIFDFEQNLEVGTISFRAGQAPDFCVVPYGQTKPAAPSTDHKPGLRIIIKLSKKCGGDIREMASTAKAFLGGMDILHDEYLKGVKANRGKLPVVYLKGTTIIVSQGGGQKSSNYAPVWAIARWVDRPEDLVPMPKSISSPASSASPPSTGSTKVSAAVVDDDEDDFG
jgi:hypothetical protein